MPAFITSPRNLNWLIVFGCIFMMAIALIVFERMMRLAPCPMCIFQRIGVVVVGLIALTAALHNPGITGTRIYGGLTIIATSAGGALAGRHIWLQSLPEGEVPACGPGLDYLMDIFPLSDVIRMVLQGDGSCTEVVWSFMGLSLPGWTLVGFITLTVLGCFKVLRRA